MSGATRREICLNIVPGRRERLENLWNYEVELERLRFTRAPAEEISTVERRIRFLRRLYGLGPRA